MWEYDIAVSILSSCIFGWFLIETNIWELYPQIHIMHTKDKPSHLNILLWSNDKKVLALRLFNKPEKNLKWIQSEIIIIFLFWKSKLGNLKILSWIK